MSNSIEISYLQVLYTIAWSDGKLQEEELELLSDVEVEFDLDKKSREFLKNWRSTPKSFEDLDNIDFSSWSIEQKKHVYFLAMQVAKADGITTPEESKFLTLFSEQINLQEISESELINEIEQDVELYGNTAQ